MISESFAIEIFNLYHKGESENAMAYGLNIDDIENNIINSTLILSKPDVYQLIDTISDDASGLIWDAIAVTTQGWAAPIEPDDNSDVPPSQHKDRRRVLLMCLITRDHEMFSVLKLEDENPIFETTGTGNLAEALKAIYPKEKLTYENNNSFFI